MERNTEEALFRGRTIWQWATRNCEDCQVKAEGVAVEHMWEPRWDLN